MASASSEPVSFIIKCSGLLTQPPLLISTTVASASLTRNECYRTNEEGPLWNVVSDLWYSTWSKSKSVVCIVCV